jgi:hypothetical protein
MPNLHVPASAESKSTPCKHSTAKSLHHTSSNSSHHTFFKQGLSPQMKTQEARSLPCCFSLLLLLLLYQL